MTYWKCWREAAATVLQVATFVGLVFAAGIAPASLLDLLYPEVAQEYRWFVIVISTVWGFAVAVSSVALCIWWENRHDA